VKKSELALATPYDLRAEIEALGFNQSSFARRLQELGDNRPIKSIIRSVQRMVSGEARVGGETRGVVGLLEETQVLRQGVVKSRLDALGVFNASIARRLDDVLRCLGQAGPMS
jgi:hypothetical protein